MIFGFLGIFWSYIEKNTNLIFGNTKIVEKIEEAKDYKSHVVSVNSFEMIEIIDKYNIDLLSTE